MKHNIKTGQTVYRNFGAKDVKSYLVTKVGNKYFYLDNDFHNRYPISLEDLMYRNKDYSQWNFRVYLDKQEILDEKEHKALFTDIKDSGFDYYQPDRYTLEQLRAIKAIISQSNDK